MKTLTEWNIEATRRFLTDPEFHARAVAAAGLTVAIGRANGIEATKDQRDMITQAVVFGMLVTEIDLAETGITAEAAVESMQSTARELGMQVVARPMTTLDFQAEAVPPKPVGRLEMLAAMEADLEDEEIV